MLSVKEQTMTIVLIKEIIQNIWLKNFHVNIENDFTSDIWNG